MRLACLLTCFVVFSQSLAFGADKVTYPYEAEVDQENGANVWSGPDSKKHYPTARLNKGDRVTVLRSDHGGWCMIEPPKGSHSWVRAEFVDKQDATCGTINSKRVKAHVGSDINPESIVTYQAELSINEPVEILGERDFVIDGAPQHMLKISPVAKREWRWIQRKSIVAVGAAKPFPSEEAVPKLLNDQAPTNDWDEVALPKSLSTITRAEKTPPIRQSQETKTKPQPSEPNQQGKQQLEEIDHEFRDMIKNETESWNLDSIESQYMLLDEETGTPWMTSQIVSRLEAVKRYRKTYNEYAEFLKITSEAKRRDELLRVQQAQYQAQMSDRSPRATPTPTPVATATPTPIPTPVATAAADPSTSSSPQPTTSTSQTQSTTATTPTFDGAGIVKKLSQSFAGGPQYVLITPEGKALTFLQPTPGIDLDRYDGKSMGIIGQRTRREDWSSDVITVRGLKPVQLRTAAAGAK